MNLCCDQLIKDISFNPPAESPVVCPNCNRNIHFTTSPHIIMAEDEGGVQTEIHRQDVINFAAYNPIS